IRLFNASASTLKLALSGYYQTAALQARDLLETAFLLDLFTHDRTLIPAWRTDANDTRFRPMNVRKLLDDRDGFAGKKRFEAYKLLCDIAGHPNPAGFRLLTSAPGGDACCGPFFDAALMTALLEELAKLIVLAAAAFMRLLEASSKADYTMKIAFME